MAQLQSSKYNIAWFKLAEFVVRKEKERALGIYRLLAYSLHDEGLASQLEGDLLLSFADDKAIDSYTRAAMLYEKNQKFVQAAAVYEHIITMQPYAIDYIHKMLKLYRYLQNETKIKKSISILIQALIKHNKIEEIEKLCNDESFSLRQRISMYEYAIPHMLDENKEYVYTYVDHAIGLLCAYDNSYLTTFLTKLEALDSDIYVHACTLLSKSD